MLTDCSDILHSVIHVVYKCFKRQKLAYVTEITELERVFYKQKNPCLCKKTVKLIYYDCVFAFRVIYQSLKTRNIYKI